MNTPDTNDPRDVFQYLSNEYAQALQAFSAIESQVATLMLLGSSGELLQFLEQFIDMASRAKEFAVEKGEKNFADWFGELIDRAAELRGGVPSR